MSDPTAEEMAEKPPHVVIAESRGWTGCYRAIPKYNDGRTDKWYGWVVRDQRGNPSPSPPWWFCCEVPRFDLEPAAARKGER